MAAIPLNEEEKKELEYLRKLEELKIREASTLDRAKASGTGALAGLGSGSAVLSGALAGGRLGAAVGAPFGAAGAVPGALIGTGLGMAAGYSAGEGFESLLPEVPPELRSWYEGGKTTGEALGGAGALRAAAKIPTALPKFLQGMGLEKGTSSAFFGKEAVPAVASGIAGGAAYDKNPEAHLNRFIAETAAGLASPSSITASVAPRMKDMALKVSSAVGFGGPAADQRAVNILSEVLYQNEQIPLDAADIEMLIKRLEAGTALPSGVSPTAAQKVSKSTLKGGSRASDVLVALEKTLARDNSEYATDVKAQAEKSANAYQALINALKDSGDPAVLEAVASARKYRFEALLDAQRMRAEDRAARAVSRIGTVGSADEARKIAGTVVQQNIESSLANAREYERMLWTRAERGSPRTGMVQREPGLGTGIVPAKPQKGSGGVQRTFVSVPNLRRKALEIASSVGPLRKGTDLSAGGKVMSILGISPKDLDLYNRGKLTDEYLSTGVVPGDYIRGGKEFSVNDLVLIRSDLLALGRDAASPNDARMFGSLSNAALDDLSKINLPGYDEARAFSKALNDSYTRTYANEIVEDAVPEYLVQKSFATANDRTASRLSEVEDAVGLMSRMYDDAVKNNLPSAEELAPYAQMSREGVDSIQEAERNIYRLAANKALGPDGRVNPAKLSEFVNQNKMILDKLGLTADMENAVSAENALRAAVDQQSAINKQIASQSYLSPLLGGKSPVKVLSEAVAKGSTKRVSDLLKVAKRGGADRQQAIDGLRSAVYEYAYTNAGGDKSFSPEAFEKALFSPIGRGQPSLAKLLRNEGVFQPSDIKNVLSLTRSMRRIENSVNNNIRLDQLDPQNLMEELLVSQYALKLASATSPGGAGSLSWASKFKDVASRYLDKMPARKMRIILEEANSNPRLMANLLRRTAPMSPKQKMQNLRALNSYMYAAGLNYFPEELESQLQGIEPTEQDEVEANLPKDGTARGFLERLFQGSPAVPSSRGVPGQEAAPAAPAPEPAAQGAPAPGPANTQSRAMLESLFPEDRLLKGLTPPPQPPAPEVPPEEEAA
jgi:hypothetical protein